MGSLRLDSGQREFLASLASVVFGNPFTPERSAVIRRLVPQAPGNLAADREALARVVAPKLQPFVAGGLGGFSEEERQLVEPAFLYVTYHRYVPQIDAHIERQADRSGEPAHVEFGDDLVGDLVRSGFSEKRAAHFFSLYFQLRRTFYFIERSLAGESAPM